MWVGPISYLYLFTSISNYWIIELSRFTGNETYSVYMYIICIHICMYDVWRVTCMRGVVVCCGGVLYILCCNWFCLCCCCVFTLQGFIFPFYNLWSLIIVSCNREINHWRESDDKYSSWAYNTMHTILLLFRHSCDNERSHHFFARHVSLIIGLLLAKLRHVQNDFDSFAIRWNRRLTN